MCAEDGGDAENGARDDSCLREPSVDCSAFTTVGANLPHEGMQEHNGAEILFDALLPRHLGLASGLLGWGERKPGAHCASEKTGEFPK